MKILCIGRNYAEHVAELNNERPSEPVIFTKPETALLRKNNPFYFPDYSENIHHEVEIVLRVAKVGKTIAEEHALSYVEAVGLGIDFTARDLQEKAKSKGLPWALAKGFDFSAPISEFVPVTEFTDLGNINFSLEINGEVRQQSNTRMMLFPIPTIISYISRFITLKIGDLIFTGTPSGVGPVKIGDRLVGKIEDKTFLDFEIK
ncbi:MAG TPA: 2-hydroxyhepta-2,4-diene-1,7-dioate isomerase [Cytophagales bacterium]|nr:2-hydroxyhepta-2,4-diene-1,7-dioate isomerase [Cytophagales bacterium]HAA19068.1 2-hydroxyhepta-2,4-diene-1,7-dioate isomerase [Cytophagales bacterium]HAP64102.1 2-hydroxyhepta-2,4-diene-1,7-dioate isomerase [Cytophagales bacterium]